MTFDFSEASLEPRFHEAAARFAKELVCQVEALGLGDLSASIDHVCYRTASVERYEVAKRCLGSCAQLLSEAFINGRPIATYRLRQPVPLGGGSNIDVVELPAPKPGVPSKCGFEHIEIVTSEPLEHFMSKHPRMPFNTVNFGAAVNRDVSLTLPSGVVKFHEVPLAEIIQREQNALRVRGESHLVVIDLDDTLVDSSEHFLRAMHASLNEFLGTQLPFADVRSAARPTLPEFLSTFGIGEVSRISSFLDVFDRCWRAASEFPVVPPGVESLLSCLRCEGFRIHVWTARDNPTTQYELKRTGLGAFFADVHSFHPERSSKPVPSESLRGLVAQAHSACLIGDSGADLAGARALGVAFLCANWVKRTTERSDDFALCKTPLEALARVMSWESRRKEMRKMMQQG